jgi:phosphatidylglycerol:prolipoprotein diacylglycerol transferase
MCQELITLPIFGGVSIHGFGAMLVLAFLSSTVLAWWRAKREHLDSDVIVDMAFWICLSGMVGARLLYCYEYWGHEIKGLWDVVQYWKGGIVFYGGIVGGMIAFFIYRRLRPFPLRPYMDVIAPSLAVGTLFGRLGCFLNGCCYGDTCQLPWAVAFPALSPPWIHHRALGMIAPDALYSLPIHPTQIYAAIDGLVLLLLLSAYFPLRTRDGEVIALAMVVYPITRFLIEFLRNDEGAYFAGLTISQNISVVLFVSGVAFWVWLRLQPSVLYRDLHPSRSARDAAVAASRS